MGVDILEIIIGMYVVLRGADYLTDGAVSLAQRMHMPEMLIGLTVVAIGTSMPELFVSVTSAVQGTADIAVANVVGSNTFNVLLIAGMSAAIAPMAIMKSTVTRDVPVVTCASALLLFCGLSGTIERWHGIVFLVLLVLYTLYAVRTASADDSLDVAEKEYSLWVALARLVGGLVALVIGSNIFVNGATEVAAWLGVSDAVIGLTIVAGGTSLPELATSVVAAHKGQSAIAMGNVLGSCVYNILLIIGLTSVITPLTIEGLTWIDFAVMLSSVSLLWLFSFTKYEVERWEGFVMVALFAAYMAYTVCSAVSV